VRRDIVFVVFAVPVPGEAVTVTCENPTTYRVTYPASWADDDPVEVSKTIADVVAEFREVQIEMTEVES
jgi:hypothetical protein